MYNVGILGATGMVGQQYIYLLENHPWFKLSFLAASERSAGKSYEEAVKNRWYKDVAIPAQIAKREVFSIQEIDKAKEQCDFVFSALGSNSAKEIEEQYAAAGLPVVSNASAHRYDSDIPVIIPEINEKHLDIIAAQQQNRGWKKGFIVTKPNCSIQSFLTAIYALNQHFPIDKIFVSTLQALSGAGNVATMNFGQNAVPFIPGEEEKSEKEPLKILGKIEDDKIVSSDRLTISAHCNRVAVVDGHLACLSLSFAEKPSREKILSCWENFESPIASYNLPSAPQKPLLYIDEADRPQPLLDISSGNGMITTLGRLRDCPLLDYRFVGLSHNTIRGAAGGAILTAELLAAKKLFS